MFVVIDAKRPGGKRTARRSSEKGMRGKHPLSGQQ